MGIVNNNSHKIVNSELLQERVSKAAMCSKCKNSKGFLQLWQQDSKRGGLCESLFSKYLISKVKNLLKEINLLIKKT